MDLDRVSVTLMRWDGPGRIAHAEVYGVLDEFDEVRLVRLHANYSVGVGFDLQKAGREKALEFGRLLRWVLRNEPDCDCEMWSPLSHSE